MIRYSTANSVYEVEPDTNLVRRVSGENDPHPTFAPDGEWKQAADVTELGHPFGGFVLVVIWPDGEVITTSRVAQTEYKPEPFEIPESGT